MLNEVMADAWRRKSNEAYWLSMCVNRAPAFFTAYYAESIAESLMTAEKHHKFWYEQVLTSRT